MTPVLTSQLFPVRFGAEEFFIALDAEPGDPIRDGVRSGTFVYFPPMLSLLGWVRPGMFVVDVGAHIGTFALAAARRGARVLAFEALPSNAAVLAASRNANGFDNLEPVNSAISDSAGQLEFFSHGPYGMQRHDGVAPEARGQLVPATTLDDALAERRIEHVDLVKIDIEGSELRALAGMRKLLGGPNPPALYVESNGYTLALQKLRPRDLVSALGSFGYSCYEILDRLRPFTVSDFQYDCVIDFFALKGPLREAFAQLVGPPASVDEVVSGISRYAEHPHFPYRLHLVRELEDAALPIRRHPQVVRALQGLQHDSVEDIRERAARLLEA